MATIANPNFNKDKEEKQGLEKPNLTVSSGQAATTPASQGVQSKTPSSGGFTNLSTYLNANKQAGQKIAGQVGQGIQKDVAGKKEAATKEQGEFKSSIDASDANVEKGQQFLSQLTPQQQAALDASSVPRTLPATQPTTTVTTPLSKTQAPSDFTSITNDPALLEQFTGLRTGATQAAAQAKQEEEQAQAVQAAQTLGETYGKRADQLGSNDRFGLLREFLAGPKQQYGRGVGALDNAFLQRDPTKSLGTLKSNLQREGVTETKSRADQLEALTKTGGETTTAGQDVAKNLQTQTAKNIEDANTYFQENAANINAQRKAEQDWANQQYKNLQEGKAIDQKFADLLGVTQGQNIADIIKRGNVSDYLNFGSTDVTTGLQALTDTDKARMNAIYQLAGQQFTAPEQIGAALTGNKQFDATQVAPSQQAMLDAFYNNAHGGWVNQLGGGVQDSVRANLSQAQYNQLLNQLGANIGNQNYAQSIMDAKNTMFDKRTPEQLALMDQLQGYNKLLGVNTDKGTIDLLKRLQDYANAQGYYNTVNINNPENTRNSGVPTNVPNVRG